jgi:DnaJ family protein C protein 7
VAALGGPESAAAAELADAYASASSLAELLALAESSSAAGDAATACAALEQAVKLSSAPSIALKLAAAELRRGNPDRVQSITLKLLKADASNVEALSLRGSAFLCAGTDFAQAITCLREALRLAPDDSVAAARFKTARKVQASLEAARAKAFSRDFEGAVAEFSACVEQLDAAGIPSTTPLHTALLCERGAAHLRLKEVEAALSDCNRALASCDDARTCKLAFITRASCLRALGRPREALESLKPALEYGDSEMSKHAEQCEFDFRKLERPDYYAILGCGRTAGPGDVKVAYKRCAMDCHPDRLVDATPKAKAEAEARFKMCGEALDVLSDDMKKQLYDQGFDLRAINEKMEAAKRAAQRTGGCGSGGCSSGGCGR